MGINMHKMEIVLLLFSLSVTSNIKIRCLKLWNIPKWIILWVVSFTTLSLSQALCKCSTNRVHLAVQQHRREEPPAPPFPVRVHVLGWHQFWVCSLFHRHSALPLLWAEAWAPGDEGNRRGDDIRKARGSSSVSHCPFLETLPVPDWPQSPKC